MKKQTVYIIQDLINEFYDSLQFTATSLVDNADGTYTLLTCDTLYLQECLKLTLLGVNYEIVEVVQGESITLKGNIAPPLTFKPYQLYYFFGNIVDTNIEMHQKESNVSKRTPFIYLLEKLTDEFNNDRGNLIDRETDLRLFFLTQSKFGKWKQSDHHDKAIIPMRNLVYKFIKFLDNSKIISNFDRYNVTDCPNFGIVRKDGGKPEALYFNDFLSGCELKITLPIYKGQHCECN